MASTRAQTKRKPRVTARQKLEKVGPSREKLRAIAKNKRPPQSWFDETVNPFKSK